MTEPFNFSADERRPCRREEPPLNRSIYILLAIILGWLGVHNFYAGRFIRGPLQLLCAVIPVVLYVLVSTVFNDPRAGGDRRLAIFAVSAVCAILLPVSILRDIIVTRTDGYGRWMV